MNMSRLFSDDYLFIDWKMIDPKNFFNSLKLLRNVCIIIIMIYDDDDKDIDDFD